MKRRELSSYQTVIKSCRRRTVFFHHMQATERCPYIHSLNYVQVWLSTPSAVPQPNLNISVIIIRTYTCACRSSTTNRTFDRIIAGSTGVDVITISLHIQNRNNNPALSSELRISVPSQFMFSSISVSMIDQNVCVCVCDMLQMLSFCIIIHDKSFTVRIRPTAYC